MVVLLQNDNSNVATRLCINVIATKYYTHAHRQTYTNTKYRQIHTHTDKHTLNIDTYIFIIIHIYIIYKNYRFTNLSKGLSRRDKTMRLRSS